MNNDISFVFQLILESFTQPRKVAEYLISRKLSRNSNWLILGLVAVLSALVLSAVSAVTPAPPDVQTLSLSPWIAAVFVGVVMLTLVFALFYVGQWMGGTGSLDDTILIISWHQGITVAFQIAQLALVLLSPSLGAIANLIGIIFLFYVLLQFIDVLHGFGSLAKAFGTFAVAMVCMMLGMAVLMSMLGFSALGAA